MRWHDQIVWRNAWILEGGWRNVSKALNIPIVVNKIFIIIGIGCGGSKDNTTKHIMIGLVFHALRMSLMGMGSCIWINTEAHGWLWIKLRFWIGFAKISQGKSKLYDKPKEDWLEIFGFPVDGRLQGYVVKRARDFLSYVLDLVMVVST